MHTKSSASKSKKTLKSIKNILGGMNHGGQVKKARGGGVEVRGKTKGAMFKTGGQVK